MLKQIVLITDGCSNEGVSPVVAAAQAQLESVVVNVIGIVNGGELGDRGAAEIEAIARAGGGISRMVSPRKLAQTVQMMTHKTVIHTIRGVVNQQLTQILRDIKDPREELGSSMHHTAYNSNTYRNSRSNFTSRSFNPTLQELPLFQRAQVVKVIENLSETTPLQVAILVDASTSMRPKLQVVKEAIHDLMLSFQARKGPSEIAVFHYPGSVNPLNIIEMDTGWTKDLAKTANLFYKLNMKGTTPTGPALFRLLQFMTHGALDQEEQHLGAFSDSPYDVPVNRKDGMLSDYIV